MKNSGGDNFSCSVYNAVLSQKVKTLMRFLCVRQIIVSSVLKKFQEVYHVYENNVCIIYIVRGV